MGLYPTDHIYARIQEFLRGTTQLLRFLPKIDNKLTFQDQLRGLVCLPYMTTETAIIIPVDFAKGTAVKKEGKVTTYFHLKDRDWTRFGKKHDGAIRYGHHAKIYPKDCIVLFGHRQSYEGRELKETPYQKTFRVGDIAEYDSYNLSYTGKIVSITDKTVTIHSDGQNYRLNIFTFSWRNFDFDSEEAARRNADTMQSI